MDFIIGLILGAIFGVVADRIFTYLIEKRVYVKIRSSFVDSIDKGKYYSLRITNVGFEALPPYKIALFNPHIGTLFLFQHEKKTDRFPGQTDEFIITLRSLLADGCHWLPWFTHVATEEYIIGNPSEIRRHEIKPEEFQKWLFRLVVDDGDEKILYQNNPAGVALAEILRDTMQNGCLNPTWEQTCRIHITNNPWVRWRDWRKRRKELRELRESGIDV
jgi:hypothetical protein